ncbi:MAG: ornithine cyclodeaminase [Gammaproteobacteria bacterium]|nr:ornithine cyclodeaminase [Gammaproteobacteria bacterium]
MKILTVDDVVKLINEIGLQSFISYVIDALRQDFKRWSAFNLSARHATQFKNGVIELMPCSDQVWYSYKYVNGHPVNTQQGKLSVVALGQLSDSQTGYPLLLTEMTVLTAIRTAAIGAMAARYLANSQAQSLAIIGTGSQSEFQICAYQTVFPLQRVYYFDRDSQAMDKFAANLSNLGVQLIPCQSLQEAVNQAEIVITATAARCRQTLFSLEDLKPGTYIHAIGGDCPGKTELPADLIRQSKVVVEYLPQSLQEGEVQNCSKDAVYAELWELACGSKPGRENAQEITVFDSVGFALEDYSILRVVYLLSEHHTIGTNLPMIPELDDPKNLYSLFKSGHQDNKTGI